eukprot:3941019-Rhodomonas_salina.2
MAHCGSRQVVDEIQSQPVASEEQRRGMLEILKRMQAENEEAESAGESEQGKCPTELLGTALENVELDENTNWADLSEEAKKAFMKVPTSPRPFSARCWPFPLEPD